MPVPIQMLWIGDRFSTLERLCVASFLAHGHPVHLYAYGPIDGVPEGTRLLDARGILPADRVFTYAGGFGQGSPSAFSNEFRYKLLLDRGGVWCDTDVVCLRPFDFLDDVAYAFSSERLKPPVAPGREVHANAGLLKAPVGSAFAERCYAAAAAADRTAVKWGHLGPILVRRIVEELGLSEYILPPEAVCPVDWWDVPLLFKAPVPEGPGIYGIHLWNEIWRGAGLDKEATYPPEGAYEQLKSRYIRDDGAL